MQKICFSLIFLFCAQNCLSSNNRRSPSPLNNEIIALLSSHPTSNYETTADGEEERKTSPHINATPPSAIGRFTHQTTRPVTTDNRATSPLISFIEPSHGSSLRIPGNVQPLPTTTQASAENNKPLTNCQRCYITSCVTISAGFATLFLLAVSNFSTSNNHGSNSTNAPFFWPG